MRTATLPISTFAALSLLAAACGGAGTSVSDPTGTTVGDIETLPAAIDTTAGETTDTTAGETTDTTTGETTAGETGGSILIGESALGPILTDGDGFTLYQFLNDEGGDSTCYDDCAAAWPALEGTMSAGDGVDAALIGSVARTDGTTQATWSGWPLYYFANDAAPGETNGQGQGGVWFVANPTGQVPEG